MGPSSSRHASLDSINSNRGITKHKSQRRPSKPRVTLTTETNQSSNAVANALTWCCETLKLANRNPSVGPIRIHDRDDYERAVLHCHAMNLNYNIVKTADVPPVAVLMLWGGLDSTTEDPGADEESVGFELERLAHDLLPGGVLAFSTTKNDQVQVDTWMQCLGLDDCKFAMEDKVLVARGRLPWKRKEHSPMKVGLALNDKKRQTFSNRFRVDLVAENVEIVEAGSSVNVDVVLCKSLPIPLEWSRCPVVDSPVNAAVLDDRWKTNQILIQCLVGHQKIRIPKAWLGSPESYPCIAKPNDGREHLGLFLLRKAEVLTAPTPSSGWFFQEMIFHEKEVFKVSVIGSHVSCGRRPSAVAALNNNYQAVIELGRNADQHPRKGGVVQSFMDFDDDEEEIVPLPDRKSLELAAKAIQHGFGLSILGFDLVWGKETKTFNVVDINYFPSFADAPFQGELILSHLRKITGKT